MDIESDYLDSKLIPNDDIERALGTQYGIIDAVIKYTRQSYDDKLKNDIQYYMDDGYTYEHALELAKAMELYDE